MDKLFLEIKCSLNDNYQTVSLKHQCYTNESHKINPIATEAAAETAEIAEPDTAKLLPDLPSTSPTNIDLDTFYSTFVSKTIEKCAMESRAPQRSKEWHDARRFSITASNFAAAVGNNKYCSPKDLLLDKLWASFKGSEATKYGSFHEMDAQNSLKKVLDSKLLNDLYYEDSICTSFSIQECGLLKHHKQPWMAVSPDGILILEGNKGPRYILIEYKCPFFLRDSDDHPYKKCTFNIPEYYMDQIQGILGLLNKFPELIPPLQKKSFEMCLFVVWQPKQIHITRVPYNKHYYENFLEPALKDWYFEQYLPFAVLKYNGQLQKNSLDIIINI